jgi:hypothetical protein
MTDDRESGLPDEDQRSLETWGSGWKAPASLRDRTLSAARERGLVGGWDMRTKTIFMTGAAVAALVMFVAGYGIGGRTAGGSEGRAMNEGRTAESKPAPQPTGPQYGLFLYMDEAYQTAPDEATLKARIGEYSDWAKGLRESGRYVTGQKLADEGQWCRLESGALAEGPVVSDGERGILAGYFLMGAASLDEARKLAATCPHLKYGGGVEIRRIQGT